MALQPHAPAAGLIMATPFRYTTIALCRAALNILPADQVSAEDPLITAGNVAVEAAIDTYCRRHFDTVVGLEVYDAPPAVVLFVRDLISISTLLFVSAPFTVTTVPPYNPPLTVSGFTYQLLPRESARQRSRVRLLFNGIVTTWLRSNSGSMGAISISGSWGYSSAVPEQVARVALTESVNAYRAAKMMFARRGGPSGLSTEGSPILLSKEARGELDAVRLRLFRQTAA